MGDGGRIRVAGTFSVASGLIHGVAAGLHAEHPAAARTFAVLALVQVVTGLVAMVSTDKRLRLALGVASAASVGGWVVAKTVGIGFIAGLDTTESVQTADLLCAVLAALALLFAVNPRLSSRFSLDVVSSTSLAVILTVPAMISATGHVHSHSASTWPRPYFPGLGVDIGGVDGVTKAQETRARKLVVETQRDLMHWADYRVAENEGWMSIGDSKTGYEHFVNFTKLADGKFLDAKNPESIVYKVYGKTRILVSAMYMAEGDVGIDDPTLTDYAGRLMQWHVHENLCWSLGEGFRPIIVGVTDADGKCPTGSRRAAIRLPMIHVWVVPHPCGPFAAVEGIAEGQAAVPNDQRVDVCGNHSH